MSTAVPASLAPGKSTSEFGLAQLSAFGGLALVALGVALAAFHPLPDIQHELLALGAALLGGSPAVYGGYRTFLKYASAAKGYEGMANAAAAAIPGTAGTDVQKALALMEKLIDALPADPGAPPAPSPVAVAQAAGAAAAAEPAKGL